VWQGRLTVFWLSVLERFEQPAGGTSAQLTESTIDFATTQTLRRYEARLSWSERGFDGWTEPVNSEMVSLHWEPQGDHGLSDADYGDDNLGLWRNPFHVSFLDDRTIVLNLNSLNNRQPGDQVKWIRPGQIISDSGAVARRISRNDTTDNTRPVLPNDPVLPDDDGGPGDDAGGGGTMPTDPGWTTWWDVRPPGVGFQLSSKHAVPQLRGATNRQRSPLAALSSGPPTGFTGRSTPLVAEYVAEVRDGVSQSLERRPMLDSGRTFEVIPCANTASFATGAAGQSYYLGGLVKPFFYQDDEHTFLAEPQLDVSYRIETEPIDLGVVSPPRWTVDLPPVRPFVPVDPSASIAGDWAVMRPELVNNLHPAGIHRPDISADWLTLPATMIAFRGTLVGAGPPQAVVPAAESRPVTRASARSTARRSTTPPPLVVDDSGLTTEGIRGLQLATPGPGAGSIRPGQSREIE
jgi:hypothetical protein